MCAMWPPPGLVKGEGAAKGWLGMSNAAVDALVCAASQVALSSLAWHTGSWCASATSTPHAARAHCAPPPPLRRGAGSAPAARLGVLPGRGQRRQRHRGPGRGALTRAAGKACRRHQRRAACVRARSRGSCTLPAMPYMNPAMPVQTEPHSAMGQQHVFSNSPPSSINHLPQCKPSRSQQQVVFQCVHTVTPELHPAAQMARRPWLSTPEASSSTPSRTAPSGQATHTSQAWCAHVHVR